MFDYDPREYDSRDDTAYAEPRKPPRALAIVIVMSTGARTDPGGATAMTMTRGRLDAVRGRTGKARTSTAGTAIPAGLSATVTVGNAIAIHDVLRGQQGPRCAWL